jgi:catechol 2,3-dioxygenase-like lactoylglutathione lyase family enzyme
MKAIVRVLSLLALGPLAASWAQSGDQFGRAAVLKNLVELTPNAAGVTLGQWYTIVRDVDASKKFWTLLGATPVKPVDGVDVMKIHGVLVFLKKGEPAGGTVGTSVGRVDIRVPNGAEFTAKLRAAGVKMPPNAGKQAPTYRGMGWGMISSPDDMVIEVMGDPNLTLPVVSDNIHFIIPESSVTELRDWYAKVFGAQPYLDLAGNPDNPTVAAFIPGVSLKFSKSTDPSVPTKGRALDHIGFEIKNLKAFCKKLEASGVKFDQPYSKTRHKGFASAEVTDPQGTSIELTEGLDRL